MTKTFKEAYGLLIRHPPLLEGLADPAVASSAASISGDASAAPGGSRLSARPAGASAAAESDDDMPF